MVELKRGGGKKGELDEQMRHDDERGEEGEGPGAGEHRRIGKSGARGRGGGGRSGGPKQSAGGTGMK